MLRNAYEDKAVSGVSRSASSARWTQTEEASKARFRRLPPLPQLLWRLCRNKGPAMLKSRERMIWSMKQNLNPAVAKVLKRLHYPLDVILLRVRWYVAQANGVQMTFRISGSR
jgi:hypothetical protein